MSKYKFAVKRPTVSNKDRGRALSALRGKGIRSSNLKKTISKTKKKYGGIPRLPGIMQGKMEQRHSAAARRAQQEARDKFYRQLDGGSERTMYVSGRAPSRSSKSRDSRSSEPSYDMGTSYMDQQIYDFQKGREEMMAMYERMMIEQAKQAEEQRRQMEIAMRAQAQNAYSANLQPSFQLQGAGTTPKLGAAQQFRRRVGSQFGTASPYTGLAQIQSGMVNA
jgi:hypothetical protein